jgi:site-specific DNA-methyltransferase (adenine-specific)
MKKEYSGRASINLYNCDNMEFMKKLPDNYYDLAIVDLEYNIGASKPSKKPEMVKQKNGQYLRVKNNNYIHKEWDMKLSSPEYIKELFRVSKNQIIFGGNYYGLSGGYIVWDKLNGESDQFGVELAWQSFNKRTDIVYYMWQGMFQGKTCSSDIRKALLQEGDKSLNETRFHPTQKPIKLYKWLLDKYAKKGDKILDTHGGSMSLAIACWDYRFDLDVCELDSEYFNAAVERFENNILQTKMF